MSDAEYLELLRVSVDRLYRSLLDFDQADRNPPNGVRDNEFVWSLTARLRAMRQIVDEIQSRCGPRLRQLAEEAELPGPERFSSQLHQQLNLARTSSNIEGLMNWVGRFLQEVIVMRDYFRGPASVAPPTMAAVAAERPTESGPPTGAIPATIAVAEPPPTVGRLNVDIGRAIATLDGTPHDVASVQALRWLRVLAESPGLWISSRELAARDPELMNVRTDRLLDQIPLPIQGLIQSQAGRGSRIRL